MRMFNRRRSNTQARLAIAIGFAAGLGLVFWRRRRDRARARDRAIEHRAPVTQATVPTSSADMPIGAPGRNEEDRLDEAIDESFPASDPVAIRIE